MTSTFNGFSELKGHDVNHLVSFFTHPMESESQKRMFLLTATLLVDSDTFNDFMILKTSRLNLS
jgi:hypothetical protein